MTGIPKYNKICSFDECSKWRRDGDIFCRKCYISLPKNMRDALWSKDFKQISNAIHLAKEFLYEQLRSQNHNKEPKL